MLDPHTAAWVAEFDLRHPVEDWLAHEIFCLLPLPSPLPLRLRRLASDLTRRSPSLRTLHSLDLLLDDRLATSSSESIAAAYRAVALHCVIDALSVSEDNGSFRAFVDGLFSRVAYLERLGPAILAAEPLRELRMEIEPAAGSGLVRASLLQRERDTRQEALDATRVYLKSATEELGPPFLELTADIVVRNGIELGGPSGEAFTEMGEKDEDSGIRSGVAESTFGLSDAVLDHGVKEEVILLETDTEISSTAVDHSVNLEVVFFETNQQLSSLSRDTLDKDMEDDIDREQDAAMQLGKPSDKFDALLTPEVEKVANALKSSCTDLYQVVVDPLQDAIMQADEILKSRLVEMTNGMEQQEIQHQVGARRLVSAVEKGAKENSADETMEQSRKNDSPDVDGTTEQSRKNALHLNRESSVEKQMDEITNRSRSTCRDQ